VKKSRLLEKCNKSRSQSLCPAITVALATRMRYSETRLPMWKQIDFIGRRVWVGASKTEYGEGRPIPMNGGAFQIMTKWAEAFPNRQPERYIFATERYRADGGDFRPCVHSTDPTNPIGGWKEAWEAARNRAGASCRFHDLGHTACARMLESGTPPSVVATLIGWSPSTTVQMSRRYGHFGQASQVEAAKALEGKIAKIEGDCPQNPPTVAGERETGCR
jgi:integrase